MRWYWNTYWGALKFGARSGWNVFTFVLQSEYACRAYREAQRGKDRKAITAAGKQPAITEEKDQ